MDSLQVTVPEHLQEGMKRVRDGLITENPFFSEEEEEQVDSRVRRGWAFKSRAIRGKSPWGGFQSYCARNVMVKGGDDLRQEILVMQLMNKFKRVWEEAKLDLVLLPYEITLIDEGSGLLEFVANSCSIDGLKKQPGFVSIR